MWGNSFAIGQYVPLNSPIHRLDPRVKIVFVGISIINLFILQDWLSFLLWGGVILLLAFLSHLSFGYLLKSLRPLLFLLILTLVLHFFFTPGEYIWEYGFLHISREGISKGLLIVVRLCLLILVTAILTLTTSPVELTDGIEYLLSPLKRWGFPAHELAMMMTIALRFIPTLLEEAERILKAQTARGMDLESGGLVQKAKNMIPLLVPLFVNSFKRADELAIAMESRCYRGGQGRTRLRVLQLRAPDYYFLIFSFSFVTLLSVRFFLL